MSDSSSVEVNPAIGIGIGKLILEFDIILSESGVNPVLLSR